jgi:glutaryl-CoA dehydrogenase
MMTTELNFFDTNSLLPPETVEYRTQVRNYLAKEVEPHIQDCFRNETFKTDWIKSFGEFGLLGSQIQGYDCPGLDPLTYGIILQELERVDSGIRSFCSVQGSLVMSAIKFFGSEEQKKHYLPKLHRGEMVGCFGLTEPDAGSNPGGMRTKAEKVSGGYKIHGSKMWITSGTIADIAIVWARLDGKIRGFIVPKNAKGFSSINMKGKMSLRASITSELYFDQCFVDDSALLPLSDGLKSPLSCLNEARYGICFGVVGAAEACYETALSYTKERILFDKPASSYQLVQAKLVMMVQEITKAQLLNVQLAKLKATGKLKPEHVSLAKMNNCKMALVIAREARDMLGANGVIDEYPVIRHMLNLESVNTYEGTEDVHRLVVGQAITSTAAFK